VQGVGNERERIGKKADTQFDERESEVEPGADRKGRAEACRRGAVMVAVVVVVVIMMFHRSAPPACGQNSILRRCRECEGKHMKFLKCYLR